MVRRQVGSTQRTDGSGNLVQTFQTDEFGNPSLVQGTITEPFRYTGQQNDGETGFYDLRARYYAPGIGRFLTRDAFSGTTAAPLSLNRYSYVENNPVLTVDPSGRDGSTWPPDETEPEIVGGPGLPPVEVDESDIVSEAGSGAPEIAQSGSASMRPASVSKENDDSYQDTGSNDNTTGDTGASVPASMEWNYTPKKTELRGEARGGTASDIQAVVDAPSATANSVNRATGNQATYYYGKDGS